MNPTAKTRIKRFTPLQRLFHLFLMITFLVQSATGLARMFVETSWGRGLGYLFGGYEGARTVHVYVGIIMLCGLALHMIYLLLKVDWKKFPFSLTGPDSLAFGIKDVKEFFQHVAWFFGLRKAPEFDRWGYWEKFDYWAVFWGMIILGGTGLLLTWQVASSRIMPGWGLNVALWVHRIEAILAMAHVFVIHFFVGHIRRQNFPMDRAMFEGSVDLDDARHERPAWIERLEQNGQLDDVLVPESMTAQRIIYYAFGFAAVAAGLYLLIGALWNIRYIHW